MKLLQGSHALFNGIKSLWNKITGAGTTNAEQETMRYNAEQAELDRQFQSAEADKARQWQEDYYQQYQSPAALMRQYEQAGLNPALMYGDASSSGSAPSTSVPSGASASVGMPQSDPQALLSTVMQAVMAKSQINLNNANARNANSSAAEHDVNVEWKPKQFESEISKNYATTSNLLAGVQVLQQQVQQIVKNIELTDAQIDKVIAETANTEVDTAKKAIEAEGVRVNNRLLAQKILQSQAETRLANAQAYLSTTEATGVSLDNFQKGLRKQQSEATGVAASSNLQEFSINVLQTAATKLDKGLRSLWDMLF